MPGDDERFAEPMLARRERVFALDADLQVSTTLLQLSKRGDLGTEGGEMLPRPHNPEASVSTSRLAIGVGAHASLSQIDGSDTPG